MITVILSIFMLVLVLPISGCHNWVHSRVCGGGLVPGPHHVQVHPHFQHCVCCAWYKCACGMCICLYVRSTSVLVVSMWCVLIPPSVWGVYLRLTWCKQLPEWRGALTYGEVCFLPQHSPSAHQPLLGAHSKREPSLPRLERDQLLCLAS